MNAKSFFSFSIFIFLFFLIPFFSISSFTQSNISNPPINKNTGLIVGCEYLDCDFNDAFELANQIVRIIIWLAGVGFFLVILYAGTLIALNGLIFDGDFQKQVNRAKTMLRFSIIGIVITLSAYLIVDFGFDALGYRYGTPFEFKV